FSHCSSFFPYTTLFRSPVQAVWPVRISSRAGEKSSRPPPAWIAEMEARQREVAAMGHGQGENAGGSLLGSLMSMVFVVLALALRSEEHTSELQSRENLV